VIVVSHGVTVRAFTMGWMRYSPEWLDIERNPGNCWIPHIHRLSTATCGS
jgi:broad specificity phosphatase PhoE